MRLGAFLGAPSDPIAGACDPGNVSRARSLTFPYFPFVKPPISLAAAWPLGTPTQPPAPARLYCLRQYLRPVSLTPPHTHAPGSADSKRPAATCADPGRALAPQLPCRDEKRRSGRHANVETLFNLVCATPASPCVLSKVLTRRGLLARKRARVIVQRSGSAPGAIRTPRHRFSIQICIQNTPRSSPDGSGSAPRTSLWPVRRTVRARTSPERGSFTFPP